MFYKLFGMLLWKGGTALLRRKNGPTYLPAPLIAGAVVAIGVGVGLLFAKRDTDWAFGRGGGDPRPQQLFWAPPIRLARSPAVTESIPASILDGLTLEAVEWLPSGAEGGLVRVRGRWAPGPAHPAGLPALCAQVGGTVSRVESLPDAPSIRGDGSVWRGAYLVPESVARGALWLEWGSGERSALPTPAGLDERAAPASLLEPEPAEEAQRGGEVIDRAVMAERRARRAEAAGQAQARVASEA